MAGAPRSFRGQFVAASLCVSLFGAVSANVADASTSVAPGFTVTANEPATGLVVGQGPQLIAPITIREATADAVSDLDLNLTLTGSAVWDRATQPRVTAVGGDAEIASVTFTDAATLKVSLSRTSATAPATYQLSGLKVLPSRTGEVLLTIVGAATTYTSDQVAAVAIDVHRIAGADRYATAANAFEEAIPGCNANNNVAVLARGDVFADALTANYLAGQLGTGVLLTKPDQLPKPTLDALRTAGVYRVYVVGGLDAISQKVRDELARTMSYYCEPVLAPAPTKIQVINVPSGRDRYATAAEVAGYFANSLIGRVDVSGLSGSPLRTAVLASGEGFADALAAGPVIYSGRFPLLLAQRGVLPRDIRLAIQNLGIQQVIITGGTDVVSLAVEDSLAPMGVRVLRLGGVDRGATAAAIAHFAVAKFNDVGLPVGLGFDGTRHVLVRGDSFADALALGPVAGRTKNPLVLASGPGQLGASAQRYLAETGRAEVARTPGGTSTTALGRIESLVVAGGPQALAEATVLAALGAAATR
jgi:putative cell wall-binding protein